MPKTFHFIALCGTRSAQGNIGNEQLNCSEILKLQHIFRLYAPLIDYRKLFAQIIIARLTRIIEHVRQNINFNFMNVRRRLRKFIFFRAFQNLIFC